MAHPHPPSVVPNSRWRHFKEGTDYVVIQVGIHTETGEEMVIYRPLTALKPVWIRPKSMWHDEVTPGQPRFQRVYE